MKVHWTLKGQAMKMNPAGRLSINDDQTK